MTSQTDTVRFCKINGLAVVLITICFVWQAAGNTVHRKEGKKLRMTTNVADVQGDLHMAVASVLGNGHGIETAYLQSIRQKLTPMWTALPKNGQGNVDRATFRYALQRYFLKTLSLSIVGLDPLQVNGSTQEAALLTNYAPIMVRNMIEGKAATHGFSIEDAVAMAATLEKFVTHSNHGILEAIYASRGKQLSGTVNRAELSRMLELFIIRLMIGDDQETIDVLEGNQTLLEESFDDWEDIRAYSMGAVKSMEHWRSVTPANTSGYEATNSKHVWRPMVPRYSFDDVEEVVGNIALEFGHFWETECIRIRDILVGMDYGSTGRVATKIFYNAAMHGEWRFAESMEYLRGLGALDETSVVKGPQVIIANYIQGASNCIISQEHYRVCCHNECEDILSEFETLVGSPVATPEAILSIVKNNLTVSLDDSPIKVSSSLQSQLQEITKVNNGKVPLHGRLFSQWLHYVFPHYCPFPHKSGTTIALTPLEFGMDYMASDTEMSTHAKAKGTVGEEGSQAASSDDDWMSQWTQEEELITDHSLLHSSKIGFGKPVVILGFIALIAGGLKFGGPLGCHTKEQLLPGMDHGGLPYSMKSHSHML